MARLARNGRFGEHEPGRPSKGFALTWYRALNLVPPSAWAPRAHSSSPGKLLARGGGAPLLPGNESRIVRHGTAQQTVMLAKSTKLKHGTKLGRTLCYLERVLSLATLPILIHFHRAWY